MDLDTRKITEKALVSKIIFRLLTESDIKALEWDGEFIHYRNLYRAVYKDMLRGKSLMWGIELEQNNLIGQLFVQLDSKYPAMADGVNNAYIFGFRVKPNYRNFGIGSKLLEFIEADLRRRNYEFVTLHVAKENLRGKTFYIRHGYKILSSVNGNWSYIDHQGNLRNVREPSWRMGKNLISDFSN